MGLEIFNEIELDNINLKTCPKCLFNLYITKDNIHENNTIKNSEMIFECENCGKIYRIAIKDFSVEEINND